MSTETETVRVQIDSDEWYPVYDAEIAGTSCFGSGVVVTVPKDKFKKRGRILGGFIQMQRELKALYEGENKG